MASDEQRLKVLIVDDEPPARAVIRKMLAEDPSVEITGECANGTEALEACAELAPDLLFLDIRMPGMNGFELLEAFGGENLPAVVFVTAYDRYAVRAFEVSAVDYLLKPFDFERFGQALEKAKKSLLEQTAGERGERMLELLEKLDRGRRRDGRKHRIERFVVREGGRARLIPAPDVDWIGSDGNYLILHTRHGEKHIIRETLKNAEKRLDPEQFFRIHRSTIVNIARVREFQSHFAGSHLVVMKDGTELPLSRRYRERLSKKLGTPL